MFVYVLNCHGQPLMPCRPRKARLLLKEGLAKAVRMVPFTIQLLYGSSGYTQEVSLGVDTGTQHIGVSATTEKSVLFEAEVKPRTDIQELLAARKQFRSARRNRKTRYRQARFLNRKKPEGWLAPSVQHKVDAHLKAIRLVHKLLPISSATIEVAQFDLQKIENSDINGVEYQQGRQLGFWNVREYVLFRDNHTCQWCKGKSKDCVLNVQHIESRKTGGDSPDTRITNELDKSHLIDARCIRGNPLASSDGTWHLVKLVRRNNRQLHKATIRKGGKRQRNTSPKYVHGFCLFDCVCYQGKICFVFGRRSSGYFDLRLLDGTKVHASVSCKKFYVVQKASALLVERRAAFPPAA
jgi:hypothetical protein